MSNFAARSWPRRAGRALYLALEAPDSVDGRFELLTLHVGLALRRLVALGGLGDDIAQDLVNAHFMHLDDTLREQALSDIAVSKRLKAMKAAFYGRNAAYAAALDSGSRADLAAALARNVYGAPPGRSQGARARRLCRRDRRGAGRDADRRFRLGPVPVSGRLACRRLAMQEPFSRIIRVDTLPKDGETVTIEANAGRARGSGRLSEAAVDRTAVGARSR